MVHISFIASVCAGLVVGVWHLNLAIQAIFVFRNDEPLTAWIAIFLGPGSTLLASLLAIFYPKIGGYWLILGGVIAFVIFMLGEKGLTENVSPFLWRISAPMVLVGISILIFSAKPR